MRKVVVILFVVLFILHQDIWNWDNASLVFGFIPVGLAYHAAYSLAAVALWLFAISFAWPKELEEWAESGEGDDGSGSSAATKGGSPQ